MKITFEKLDRGYLVTAEETGTPTERLAYESPVEAFSAVGQALGISVPRETPRTAPRAPVAPSPEPEYVEQATSLLDEPPPPPPATRRIGLTGATKRVGPPAGRLGGAR